MDANLETQKKDLLLDLIWFAQIDGELHDKEFLFLTLIANSLGIDEKDFKQLFHIEKKISKPATEIARYLQFYKLALLMFADGVKHPKEVQTLAEIGIFLGLNPFATKRIVQLMEKAPHKTISPKIITSIIQEQHN